MRDATVAVAPQEEYLRFPVVAIQGPAMRENDRLSIRTANVVVVDLRVVIGRHERHWDCFSVVEVLRIVQRKEIQLECIVRPS